LGVLHIPCDSCVTSGVAVRPDGNVLVEANAADDSFKPIATYELTPDGQVLRSWAEGGESIAVGGPGDTLYVAWTGAQGHAGGWVFIRAYALPPD
jgi:hypothetical protein